MKTGISDFLEKKIAQVPISMTTCYDAWSARLIAASPIDAILVGDSLGMVMHGYDTTLPVDTDLVALHTRAVRRGAPDTFLIADMPFISHRCGLGTAVENAGCLMRAGAQAVKIEGASGNLDTIRVLVESGIPVMGHLGLTPQSVHQLGGFRVQARDEDSAVRLENDACDLEAAGCFALVLEAVPADLAARVTSSLSIPTIGIGAGRGTDGQILVLHDLLGLTGPPRPKFVRDFMRGEQLMREALARFHNAVKSGDFPNQSETYQ